LAFLNIPCSAFPIPRATYEKRMELLIGIKLISGFPGQRALTIVVFPVPEGRTAGCRVTKPCPKRRVRDISTANRRIEVGASLLIWASPRCSPSFKVDLSLKNSRVAVVQPPGGPSGNPRGKSACSPGSDGEQVGAAQSGPPADIAGTAACQPLCRALPDRPPQNRG